MRHLLLLLALLLAAPAWAGAEEDECAAAIDHARRLTAAMPSDDLSRRFAERHLNDAQRELDAGEVDECPEFVELAHKIIETRPYVLRPGERLRGYGPDDKN